MKLDRVERVVDFVGRAFLPLLPWAFLALRRALIATLVAVIVAVMLFVVPQSREVLLGLTEASSKSTQAVGALSVALINHWGYLFYVVTAVALGLATWYSARLLCTVEAEIATPYALAQSTEFASLQHATTWLPRALGVFVLASAIGALLYASYTPRLSRAEALGLVALAVAGALIVAGGKMAGSKLAQRVGLLVMAGGFAVLWLAAKDGRWQVAVASALVSVLPGVLLWFLMMRRTLVNMGQQAHDSRSFGEAITALATIVAASVGLLLLLAFLPAGAVRAYGSAAAVLLFLTAAVLLLSGLHVILRRMGRNVPGVTAFVVAVFAVCVAVLGEETLGTERLQLEPVLDSANADRTAALEGAINHPKAPKVPAEITKPSGALYVNAHGGGLRAAAFTAQVLASADDVSCGRFGQQLVALSGVSGGALGIATYLVARQAFLRRGGWEKQCEPGIDQKRLPLTDIVGQALFQDHLSPVVARMLSVDAPHLPWSPARGQALLDSWQSALMDALGTGEKGIQGASGFALRLGSLTGGLAPSPVVLFNATDADTGHIVSYSNREGGQAHFFSAQTKNSRDAVGEKKINIVETERVPEMSVGQAVLHSARFPVVSPAGRIEVPSPGGQGKAIGNVKVHRLVDGGYADNSGTTTLQRVLAENAHGALQPKLINIDGNPPSCVEAEGNPPLLTGVRGLLQARTAHAALAVAEFKAASAQWVDVVFDLRDTLSENIDEKARCEEVRKLHHAPLGWYISRSAARNMAASVRIGMQKVCADLGNICAAGPAREH